MVREFQTDWDREKEHSKLPIWDRIYKQLYPDLISTERAIDFHHQKRGVDRRINLPDRVVLVEEKTRFRNRYPDMSVEIWSDFEKKVEGWAVKRLDCHYILYLFDATGEYYFIPFREFRVYILGNYSRLQQRCRELRTPNKRRGGGIYTTVSLLVPWDLLLEKIPSIIYGEVDTSGTE